MSQPADQPRARAIIRPDGSTEVALDGVSQTLYAASVEDARANLVQYLAYRAQPLGRSIWVDVDDPAGPVHLVVNPDASVGEQPAQEAAAPPVPPAPVVDDAPDETTIPPGEAPQGAAVDPAAMWGPRDAAAEPAGEAAGTPSPTAATADEPDVDPSPEAAAIPEDRTVPVGSVRAVMQAGAPFPPPQPSQQQTPPSPPVRVAEVQPRPMPTQAPSGPVPQPDMPTPAPWQASAGPNAAAPWAGSPAVAPQQPQPQPSVPQPGPVQPGLPQPGWSQGSGEQPGTPWGGGQPEATPQTRRQMRESFLRSEQTEAPATRGVRGALSRVGIRTQPSAAERSEREDVHAVSQHWPGVRTIAVVNGKGGAGKTPTTALLAATFARYSGAATIAWDNNETRGTLGWRTEQGKHENTVLQLIPRAEELMDPTARAGDISHYVHHQAADKYDVLRSNPSLLSSEQRITSGDVDAVHDVLGRYYRLIFVDSGNDESAGHWLQMIEKADQIVVPTIAKAEHAEAGALLLEALAARGGKAAQLAQRAIVIVSQAREKDANPSAAEIASGFTSWVPAVVTIPYAPAMVESVLRFDALAPRTKRAWLRAAAAVARQL